MTTTNGSLINGEEVQNNVPVGQGTKTFSISNLKAAQEDPLLMFKDHTRNSIRLYPNDNQTEFSVGRNMTFDFISKGQYHFLNWNRAIMHAYVKVNIPLSAALINAGVALDSVVPYGRNAVYAAGNPVPYDNFLIGNNAAVDGFNLTLPYSVSSLFQRYILRIGTIEVENINYYNHLVPYLERIQCEKIEDGTTWRLKDNAPQDQYFPKNKDLINYNTVAQTADFGNAVATPAAMTTTFKPIADQWKNNFKGLDGNGYFPIVVDKLVSRTIRFNTERTSTLTNTRQITYTAAGTGALDEGTVIAILADGIRGVTLYFPVQIPIFTCLEQGGWFPIYNMWQTITTQFTLDAFDKIFYFETANANNQWGTPTYSIYQPFLELETLTVKNDMGLDMAPYTFKSVTWDVIPQQITLFNDKTKQWGRTLEERYRNIAGMLCWLEDNNINKPSLVDRLVNFLKEKDDTRYAVPALLNEPNVILRIAGVNWPNQNARDYLLLLYMSWCEFFNKYDDNGMIDPNFIDFQRWIEIGGFACDLSVLTETPNIMSGVNVRRIPLQVQFKVSENSKMKANNEYYLYYGFVRNIILSFFQGTCEKQE